MKLRVKISDPALLFSQPDWDSSSGQPTDAAACKAVEGCSYF